ncbi:amidohydrolase [Embleya sp. NPDC005971]|uniref:amidohydrolase n=1 Tax=Embleya sp. NPDC005971 TaxID=3156724 RepID=UPI0033F91DB1
MKPADLVVLDAHVVTMDEDRPDTDAIAARNGRIVALGADARALIGPRTEVIEANGDTVTPGLTDCHQHPVMGADTTRGADLVGAVTLDEVLRRLAEQAAPCGDNDWVIGFGGEYAAFAGHTMHRDLIDAAVGGRPAFVWMSDSHTALLSTAALRIAGLTGPREFADHSEIVCDERGPTGELHEMTACLLGYRAVPPMPRAELLSRVEALFAEQNRCGITGIHIPDDAPRTVDTLTGLTDERRLSMRVHLAPWCPAGNVDDLAERILELRSLDGPVELAAVKFFADGAIDGGGAWLHEPDCCGQSHHSQWKDFDRYAEAVAIAGRAGLPAWTHAIGDRAVARTLDVYAEHGAPPGTRHRVEHAEVLADAEVPRFAALDVVASMQPTHMDWSLPDGSDNWSRRVGPERAERAWRYADILAAGGHVALGSDWPVAAFDPRRTLAGAQLRRPAGEIDRAAYGASAGISARRALAGYTTEAAYSVGRETVAGRIAVGYRADLTVFGGDPLTCAPDDLPELPVTATVVAGRIVHRT